MTSLKMNEITSLDALTKIQIHSEPENIFKLCFQQKVAKWRPYDTVAGFL